MQQELQSNWQSVSEFLRRPSIRHFIYAVAGILAFLGFIGGLYYGITRRNLYGDLLHVFIQLARSIGITLRHTHATTSLWFILTLSVALLAALIMMLTFNFRSRRAMRREARLAEVYREEKAKSELFKTDGESYKSERDAAKESEIVSRQTLAQLKKVALAIQTTAEDIMAEAEVWRQVGDRFLFLPRPVSEALANGHSVQEELATIRGRYEQGRKALQVTEPIVDAVAGLLENDKDLATEVIRLIRRSIDRQPAPQPESITTSVIERQTRTRFGEALASFGHDLALAEYTCRDGSALNAILAVFKGREDAARKVTDSKEQAIEAVNGLLDVAIDLTRPAFHADRGFIFVPDSQEQELVRCAATKLNVIERTHPSKFYIGNSADRLTERGVAGHSYVLHEPIACHWNEESGRYEDKYNAAATFTHGIRYSKDDVPEYQSFIAIPLYWPLLGGFESNTDGGSTKVEGVLCLDARAPNVFRDHFLLNSEAGYQQPSAVLIGVIYELVRWRRSIPIQP